MARRKLPAWLRPPPQPIRRDTTIASPHATPEAQDTPRVLDTPGVQDTFKAQDGPGANDSLVTRLRLGDASRVFRLREDGTSRIFRLRQDGTSRVSRLRQDGTSWVTQLREDGVTRVSRLREDGASRVEELRRRGVERIVGAPATERVVERLHRAATGLAEVTSDVSAYAGLLEEKAGELHDRTRSRRDP